MLKLNDKTILVTGASSGIGAQCAILLAQLGAKIILTGRSHEKLNLVYEKLSGSGHQIIAADLTSSEEILVLVEKSPNLDGIVMSTGIIKAFPIKFIDQKQIDHVFNTNYSGPVKLISKLFRQKKVNDESSIVFMSSISSKFPHKGGALYSGTKAAINSYSKTIALEYAGKKIRSNVICAAMVKTPLFDDAEKTITKELMDLHETHYPLGFGETEDVANTVAFLLSGMSKWITGTEIIMDGGLTAGQ